MSTNFNGRREKHGNKLRKINTLTKIISKIIDEDQEIKRYVLYGTDNPLGTKAKNIGGKIISQFNIDYSILEPTKDHIQVMFNEPFNQEILDVKKVCHIFIYPRSGRFRQNGIGDLEFVINVLSPSEYNNLVTGDKRIFKIGYRIEDLLDQYVIENCEEAKEVGNVMFELTESSFTRLSKVTSIENLALIFKVRTITMRSDD